MRKPRILYNVRMRAAFADPFWILRLMRGEEIIASLSAWARATGLEGGQISGLGAMRDATLGYYDESSRDYLRRDHPGPVEILSLSGGIARLEGKPYIHLHAVVSDREGRAFGGHLFRGTVTATGEIYVLPSRLLLQRAKDPVEPFSLLDLPDVPLEAP
jgi:predicted DNA-binding protein with PD1-like motif